jgi:hypothetical protein
MTKLEKLTHILLIAVCCIAGFLLIESRLSRNSPESGAAALVGQPIRLPGVDWQATPMTVVLQISSNCHFCNESMPFYHKLVEARHRQGDRVGLIVASQDGIRLMQDHLAGQQLIVDKVLHARLDSMGLTGTPTILLVDARGVVKRTFLGKLDSSGERQLLSIVERGKV